MIDDLLAARLQMAISLGFHIVFAAIGMAMPFLMAFAHWRWLKTEELVYRDLTKAWLKGVAIFFATGAVSGTVLSFELGLLWPEFMRHAGPIIGMPFSWEGTAFFLEAIAIGIFLYGWGRLGPKAHWLSGLAVGVSGVASGVFVIAANGWMNAPSGFDWVDGRALNIDPWRAMWNAAFPLEALHMVIAAFQATGFAVAGVHAAALLADPRHGLHRRALKIALGFAAIFALLQPLAGDFLAKDVAQRQPIKLAAMEAHFHTEQGASLLIGGIPDESTGTLAYGVRVPRLLSVLAFGDPDATVRGLEEFPRESWPPVAPTHFAFQVMVGLGTLLAVLGAYCLFLLWRAPERLFRKAMLRILALTTPLGFIAIEAGWVVTEVGRQPWVIYEIMRTKDAVTPMPGLVVPLALFTALYVFLAVVLAWLLSRQVRAVAKLGPWEDEP